MNSENAIEIRNMSKSFKIQYDKANALKNRLVIKRNNRVEVHEVLRNINLDIKKGDTVALIGTNGSGKSTLLKLMTKIIYPTSGLIHTSGKLSSLLELGAGFHPDFTGRENIYFNAAIFGMSHEEIESRVQDIIDFSELGSFIDEPIRTYSSGMYMRLAFSVAINVDADILLIDEILAVGDQHFQDKCFAKLKELKNGDTTIVIVTHSLDVVKDMCNRAIWIYDGQFRLDGDPTYVIGEYLRALNTESSTKDIRSNNSEKSGLIYIDQPNDRVHIHPSIPQEVFRGWKLCTDQDADFVLKIGEKQITGLSMFPRPDVIAAYHEQYGGKVDTSNIGWSVSVNFNDYMDQLNDGKFKVSAELISKQGQVISARVVTVLWDEEV